jgi:hypothetical protein
VATIENNVAGKFFWLIAAITDVFVNGRFELYSCAVLHTGAYPAWKYADEAQLASLQNGMRIIASYVSVTTKSHRTTNFLCKHLKHSEGSVPRRDSVR